MPASPCSAQSRKRGIAVARPTGAIASSWCRIRMATCCACSRTSANRPRRQAAGSSVSHRWGSTMYKLYGVKKWGSLAPQCILEEVGAPYEMVWLSPEDRRGAYRKINPLGYVPSLQLADGRFVFESSAIVTHITDAYPSALAPRPGTPDHAMYLSWLTWINAEIYSTINAADR